MVKIPSLLFELFYAKISNYFDQTLTDAVCVSTVKNIQVIHMLGHINLVYHQLGLKANNDAILITVSLTMIIVVLFYITWQISSSLFIQISYFIEWPAHVWKQLAIALRFIIEIFKAEPFFLGTVFGHQITIVIKGHTVFAEPVEQHYAMSWPWSAIGIIMKVSQFIQCFRSWHD